MTAAQQDAIRRAAASIEPVKIPTATARILAERYGYVEENSGGWVLTPRGRAHLASERARQKEREVESKLTREDRDWAERVECWLKAHERFNRNPYHRVWTYARHVAACDHAGVQPVAVGQWGDGAREWVEDAVRAAAQVVRDFDETIELAQQRGVGVSVSYEADDKVPRSRREAAGAASSASVVSLLIYRERRPNPGAA